VSEGAFEEREGEKDRKKRKEAADRRKEGTMSSQQQLQQHASKTRGEMKRADKRSSITILVLGDGEL
jgi:hypothetical protein